MEQIERVYKQIAEFAESRGARRVILFGSRARGDAAPKSDIDIAIAGCDDIGAFEDDIAERLWSLLSVDVVDLDAYVSPELRRNIERDGKVIHEKVR